MNEFIFNKPMVYYSTFAVYGAGTKIRDGTVRGVRFKGHITSFWAKG